MIERSPQKVHHTPRMSVPKLGEYYTSTSARRREKILRDQKYPEGLITARYTQANNAIAKSLISGADIPARLEKFAAALAGEPTTTAYQSEKMRSCSIALRRFAKLHPKLAIDGVSALPAGRASFMITLEGVPISVWPTVLLERTLRSGDVERGALLAVFRKSEPLEERACIAIAEIMRQALVESGYDAVTPKLCIVADVFSGRVARPPARNVRLRGEIESVCREIADRWPSVRAA